MTDMARGDATENLDGLVSAAPSPPSTPPPPTPNAATGTPSGVVKYNLDLDETRKQLAYMLLWIMIGVIAVLMLVSLVYSVRCWLNAGTCPAANDALGILASHVSPVFTAMVGLVGSVVGFYFGSKQN
jgi:hypothetical protein